MYLYAIFSLMSVFAIAEANRGTYIKKFKLVFLIFMGLLFSLSFLRWERGTDWNSYLFNFERVGSWDTRLDFEYLYSFLYKFVKLTLRGDYTFLLFVIALIIYPLNYKILLKYARYPVLSLLTWYSFTFGGIFFTRQLIAISIVFYSIEFLIDKKMKWFLLTIFIASLFHRTAIVFSIAYFVFHLNYTRKQVFLFLLFFSAIGLVFTTGVLQFVGELLGGFFGQRIKAYTEVGTSSSYASSYSPLETLIRGSVYRLAIVFYVIAFHFTSYKKDVFFRGIFNLYVVGCLLFFILAPISPTLIRVSLYFETFQVFLYPYFIFTKRDKAVRVLSCFVLIFYMLFRFYGVIQTYKDLYIPYKSIFNKSLPVKVY